MSDLPIGIFDSGLGGLSVLKKIKKLLPNESIVYLGDTARVPYGTRSKEVVRKFALEDVEFLKKLGVKCIIAACNTVSSLVIEAVRQFSGTPVFDVVTSGVANAVKNTINKNIGVVGTRGTINSGSYEYAIMNLNNSINVFSTATPLLVPFIEEGETSGSIIESLVRKYLKSFEVHNIDTLILGCTHYPIISDLFKKCLPNTNLIDPADGLAQELYLYLNDNGLLSTQKDNGEISYYVTDLTDRFTTTAEMFLEEKVQGKIKRIDL